MRMYASQGFRGEIWDLDTGLKVHKVIWYDSDTQELEAYEVDLQGTEIRDINGDFITYHAKGRFRYMPVTIAPPKSMSLGSPRCARCGNPLTLQGHDLCPVCNAQDKGYKGIQSIRRLSTPILDRPCEVKGCGRLAEYQVADEVPATPAVTKPVTIKGFKTTLWDRAVMVGVRYFCAWHFKPPRLLDAKGEVVQEFENEVRPETTSSQPDANI